MQTPRAARQGSPNGYNSGVSINDGESTSENLQSAALLTPDEVGIVFSRESRRMLVLINGAYPLVLNRVRCYGRFEFMVKVGQDEARPRVVTPWDDAREFREAQMRAKTEGPITGKAKSSGWVARAFCRGSTA